jgi:hypothetical protein
MRIRRWEEEIDWEDRSEEEKGGEEKMGGRIMGRGRGIEEKIRKKRR